MSRPTTVVHNGTVSQNQSGPAEEQEILNKTGNLLHCLVNYSAYQKFLTTHENNILLHKPAKSPDFVGSFPISRLSTDIAQNFSFCEKML